MLRQKGDLCQGVELGNGGLVRIEMNYINVELPEDLPDYKMDHRNLKVCKGLKEEKENEKVILVTKDILLRIKAQALGILSEDFQTEQVPKEPSQYTGRREVYAPEELFKDFKKKGMDPKEVYQVDEEGNKLEVFLEINEFLIIKADQSNKKTQLGRFDGKKIVALHYKISKPYGIKPRNAGQYFLQEALMERKMPIKQVAKIMTAIGQHDEKTGTPVDAISAAIILADKTDVRRNRVRNKNKASFDKHDTVNYAVEHAKLTIDKEKKVILFAIELDENTCSVMDYFEIFLDRMLMCRKAAERFGMKFKMTANGSKVC